MLGLTELLPMVLYTLASLVILCFAFFKAGSIIFSQTASEPLFSLPVSETAIIISRFLTMYVTNLFFAAGVMLPGCVVYCIYTKPGVSFYVMTLLGILMLPLFPLTIASILGAGITALTSRLKHRSVWSSLLMIAVIVAIMAGSMQLPAEGDSINIENMQKLAELATERIGTFYPPAAFFAGAASRAGSFGEKMLSLLELFLISVLPLAGLVLVLRHSFLKICAALASGVGHTKYSRRELKQNSLLRALVTRDLRRYFASSIYVTNTLTGYVLMLVLAVALYITGVEKLEEMLQMPGILRVVYPLLLGWLVAMMPTTSCSISMEGKQWWQLQSLPVRKKDIYDSKILMNLLVAAPFLAVALVFSVLALKPSLAEGVWIVLFPVASLVFSSVAGLSINLAFPVMNWDNEVRVVKQSASTFFSMLVSLGIILPPAVCQFMLPKQYTGMAQGVVLVLMLALAAVLYGRNSKKEMEPGA